MYLILEEDICIKNYIFGESETRVYNQSAGVLKNQVYFPTFW